MVVEHVCIEVDDMCLPVLKRSSIILSGLLRWLVVFDGKTVVRFYLPCGEPEVVVVRESAEMLFPT